MPMDAGLGSVVRPRPRARVHTQTDPLRHGSARNAFRIPFLTATLTQGLDADSSCPEKRTCEPWPCAGVGRPVDALFRQHDGLAPCPRSSLPQADETAAKALQLDPSLPEANLAAGAALFFPPMGLEWADQAVRRAIELDPRYAEAYHLRARIMTALNRNSEAIEAQKKQMDLDPFARPWALACTFYVARQYDAAIDEARLRLENSPRDRFSKPPPSATGPSLRASLRG